MACELFPEGRGLHVQHCVAWDDDLAYPPPPPCTHDLHVQASIVPPIVSHGYGSGFASGFVWDGCRDYSGVLAVPAILRFWEHVGLSSARSYCRELLAAACALLCEVCVSGHAEFSRDGVGTSHPTRSRS